MLTLRINESMTCKNSYASTEDAFQKVSLPQVQSSLKSRIESDLFHTGYLHAYGIKNITLEIKNAELFVDAWFASKGYLPVRGFFALKTALQDVYVPEESFIKTLTDTHFNCGTPDFLMLKIIDCEDRIGYRNGERVVLKRELNDAFFVEVKSPKDGIRYNQLNWAFEKKHPVVYCFIEPSDELSFKGCD